MNHFGAIDEGESGQRQNALFVERGLEGKIEAGERLDRGQPRQGQCRPLLPVLAYGTFLDEQLIERFDTVDLALFDAPHSGIEHFESARLRLPRPSAVARVMVACEVAWNKAPRWPATRAFAARCDPRCRWRSARVTSTVIPALMMRA